jgi:hypothetical protein
MSIKRIDSTNWEFVYPDGEFNISLDILATSDGLVIDGDVLPWDEIEDAMRLFGVLDR